MFNLAIVALDQSPAAAPTLARLADLMEWGLKKVVLTHVVSVGYNQFADFGHGEDYRGWLEEHAGPLRAAGLEVEVSVRLSGLIADEVLAIASEFNADLIVVGSRAQSRINSLFLGSVARDLIRKTTLPLFLEWVEPGSDQLEAPFESVGKYTLDRVLLATDFSRHASGAEDAARHLSAKASETDLLTVLSPAALYHTPALPVMVEAALEDFRNHLPDGAERVNILIENGEPAETIRRIAEERDVSLIIVGKQGQGWLESKLIGTNTTALSDTVRRPLLVVPAREREDG